MLYKLIALGIWALLILLAAFGRKIKFNDRPLSPLVGAIVGPVMIAAMGMLFLGVGAVFSVPIWIWFIP